MNVQELIGAAKAAIAEGDMEKAEQYKNQAAMLKEVEGIDVAEEAPAEETEETIKTMQARIDALENEPAQKMPVAVEPEEQMEAPKVVKTLGEKESSAFSHWIKTGDDGGIKHLKASNDTDMNVGTAADGGYAVPQGHYQGVIAKLNETALYPKVGVMEVPGVGTTVNVPIDAGGGAGTSEFTETAEAADADRDAPVLGQVAMTLKKYTKYIDLSYELLQDEDSRLMNFLEQWVGDRMALTHNQLLTTEALANGTAAVDFAGAAAIATAEVPELLYSLKEQYEPGAVWLGKRSTIGAIRSLTGDSFQFLPTPQGNRTGPELFGLPVYSSEYMPEIAATNKSLMVGNFGYMGMRLAPDITFLRDPYSVAVSGQVRLHYYFRTCYSVLQAEALQYGTQAAA